MKIIERKTACNWREILSVDVTADGGELIASFKKREDADLFVAAKGTELKAIEFQKLVDQGLCVLCGKSMNGLPFKFHERCPE